MSICKNGYDGFSSVCLARAVSASQRSRLTFTSYVKGNEFDAGCPKAGPRCLGFCLTNYDHEKLTKRLITTRFSEL